jgi:hypothetical protein
MQQARRSIYVLILLLAMFSVASAQESPIAKGSKIIAGDFMFASAGGDLYKDSEDNRYNTIQLSPSGSYFLIDGLALGIATSLNWGSQGDYSSTTWAVGPQVTYFINLGKAEKTKGSVYPFVGASFMYQSSTVDFGSGESTTTGYTIVMGAGACYMLTESVGLTGQAAYQMDSQENGSSKSGSMLVVKAGLISFLR